MSDKFEQINAETSGGKRSSEHVQSHDETSEMEKKKLIQEIALADNTLDLVSIINEHSAVLARETGFSAKKIINTIDDFCHDYGSPLDMPIVFGLRDKLLQIGAVHRLRLQEHDTRLTRAISQAKNIEELKDAIASFNGIQDGDTFYYPENISDMIAKFERGDMTMEDVPRACGVRFKVFELYGKKIEKKGSKIELTKDEKLQAMEFFDKKVTTASAYDSGRTNGALSGECDENAIKYFEERFVDNLVSDGHFFAENFSKIDRIPLVLQFLKSVLPDKIKELEAHYQISAKDEISEVEQSMVEKTIPTNQENLGSLSDEQMNGETKDHEREQKLMLLGEELQNARKMYVTHENEIGVKISRMKKFFTNLVSVDKNYEIEKELAGYKKEYEHVLKNYLDAIVDMENPADKDEREIIYRYAQFGETLKLMSAKEDLKFEKNPKYEALKRKFHAGTSSLVDKYKDLLGKPKEYITKKTDSKILGFGGGMIAVGGAMAFAANYIPGLRYVTMPLSVAVATKGFYSRSESEAVIEKEKALKEGVENLESRLAYIHDLGAATDEAFKKELGLVSENMPEAAMKEREEVGRRMVRSLGKAIAVSSVFYMAGNFIREYFHSDDLQSQKEVVIPESDSKVPDQASILSDIQRSDTQSAYAVPVDGEKNIDDTMSDIGIHKPNGHVTDAIVVDDHISDHAIATESVEIDKSNDDLFTPEVQNEESFKGIKVDDSGRCTIHIVKGGGIKDTLVKLLVENNDKFTEGKMGWNPDKYASVEEWANKRATGIVAEFKEQYPKYNFDRVSTETDIVVNVSDRVDIKIEGMKDQYYLGDGKGDVAAIEDAVSRAHLLEKAVHMTDKEMRLAYASGTPSEEYARINNMTVAEFLNDKSESTLRLREMITATNVTGNQAMYSVSDALRSIDDHDMATLLQNKDVSHFKYDQYLHMIVREELRAQPEILKALNSVKDQKITIEHATFKAFQESVHKVIGEKFAAFENDLTVREYFIKSVKRAYEMGKIDDLREALAHIKL